VAGSRLAEGHPKGRVSGLDAAQNPADAAAAGRRLRGPLYRLDPGVTRVVPGEAVTWDSRSPTVQI